MAQTDILTTIKKLLGIGESDTSFDTDIIICINSAFMSLNQLGFESFIIEDDSSEWDDFITGDVNVEGVKSYIFLKTRLMFDPPQTSPLIDAIKEQIKELEFRLNIQVDI
jgi:hypothetical protein